MTGPRSIVSTLLLESLRPVGLPSPNVDSWSRIDREHGERLLEAAASHGLTGPLHARARMHESTPAWILCDLEERCRSLTARSMAIAEEQSSLVSTLEREGIDVVAIKGAALEADLYGLDEPRDQEDVDLLVAESGVDAATEILRSRGYKPAFDVPIGRVREFRISHAAMTWNHHARAFSIDLHWRLVLPRFGIRLNEPALLARSVWSRLSGRPVRVLSPEDWLLVLSVHGGKDRWASLHRLADIVRLLVNHPGIAGPAVFDSAQRARCRRMLHVALLLVDAVASELVGDDALRRCREDDAAMSLAQGVLSNAFSERAPAGRWARLRESLRYRENASDGARMLLGTLFTPTPCEWENARIPAWTYPLYRPLRLVLKGGPVA